MVAVLGVHHPKDNRSCSHQDDAREYRDRRPAPLHTGGYNPRYQGRGGYREERGGRGGYRGRGNFRGASRGRYDVSAHQRLSLPFRGERRRYPDNDEHSEQQPPYKRQR